MKDFFRFYSINRHKMTTLTPSYHAEVRRAAYSSRLLTARAASLPVLLRGFLASCRRSCSDCGGVAPAHYSAGDLAICRTTAPRTTGSTCASSCTMCAGRGSSARSTTSWHAQPPPAGAPPPLRTRRCHRLCLAGSQMQSARGSMWTAQGPFLQQGRGRATLWRPCTHRCQLGNSLRARTATFSASIRYVAKLVKEHAVGQCKFEAV